MNDLYDAQTFEVMRRVLRRDSNCVDIGCHKGDILRGIVAAAPEGKHHAFEPLPELANGVAREFPQVRVMQLALSESAGEVSFQHVVTNPGYSGLRRRRYDREGEQVQEIRVATARLDDVLPRALPIDFLKVDVEGAELQVFRGALETIKANRPLIIFEHGLGAADHYGTRPEAVYDLLTGEARLALSLMDTWLNGGAPLAREEFVWQFESGTNYYFMACDQERAERRA